MNASVLHRSQWQGYLRYHQARSNLLLHVIFVPVFVASNVAFVIALAEARWLAALAALALTGVSFVIQGYGHSKEAESPPPFTSPFNFLPRIFVEQWITFPRFVLSGGWMRALRGEQS